MAPLEPQSPYKRFFKMLLVVVIAFFLVVLGLHIWFVNNARTVLQQIVTTKSHGKINLELSQLRFEFLSNKLQIREADLASTDTINQSTTYHVKFRKLTLRVASFWPLLFKNQLLLDSIKLHDPEIEVFQWTKDTSSKVFKDELSISHEMGRLYTSMLDVLEEFGIRRIIINNAKLSLINKFKAGSEPIIISNIYFNLVRTADNIKKRDEFVENEQSVELITSNQKIDLPGGRHQLSFKRFSLELFEKRILLDSCTITAKATDSSKSSYKIFFKRLSLIGVDFNAMYTQNLIRADSVYCENPLFDIDLNPSDAVSKKKERPDPDKIIRELTGDLDLAFVGVKDAGIHINISGKKNRDFFNSNNDDFEMRGLSIKADSSKPVTVARFDMLVRDYHLYNEDSSAAYTFDSLHFVNNKIALSNFSIVISSKNKERNAKDFKIPYFEITGLDWYQLVFEENLKAKEASLYNPVINYTRTHKAPPRKKINLFTSLQGIDTLMALNKLNIINGKINMQLGPAAFLSFENANLSLYSDRILQSQNREGLRRAVDQLSFSSGLIRLKAMTATLENVRYTETNLIRADKFTLNNKGSSINASMNDVSIDNMLLDDEANILIVDGIKWNSAKIALKSLALGGNKKANVSLHLKNVSGNNTQFDFSNATTSINSFVQSLKITSLLKNNSGPISTKGFSIYGNNFFIKNNSMQLQAAGYEIEDNKPSIISGVQMVQIRTRDTLNIKAPSIRFVANVNDILAGNLHLSDLQTQSPIITLKKWNVAGPQSPGRKNSMFYIDKLSINEPTINVSTHKNDSVTIINIPKSENSFIKVTGLELDNGDLEAKSISVKTTAATYVVKTGETLGVEKGRVEVELSNVKIAGKEQNVLWSGLINNLYLQNPNSILLGKKKNKINLNSLSIGNVNLSSGYLTDFNQLLKYNVSAWLRTTTGEYIDSTTTLKWYNADYNYSTKTLSLDSFRYNPTQSRDSVIANTPYQTDYITFNAGGLKIKNFNLEKYKKDSALIAEAVDITNPVVTIYRDKLPPFLSGIIKPLPVDMIKSIVLPVSIRNINLIDGQVNYIERNAKTRAEGNILLSHINGKIANIKNRNIEKNDSLELSITSYLMDSALISLKVKESYIDSLSGFLMTLRMKPTSLTFLNPMIAPLSNVKIISGSVDSFLLRAIGHEELAFGEINMHYHNLRIKLFKNAELDQSTFSTKIASFLANSFLIRKHNNDKPGVVYFERLKDRSFFNYMVKMTFSGMAASIGVKRNKKYINEYNRQLKLKNLPPM